MPAAQGQQGWIHRHRRGPPQVSRAAAWRMQGAGVFGSARARSRANEPHSTAPAPAEDLCQAAVRPI